MPFKSEAQHRKFRVLLSQGKIDRNTFDEWMDETKEKNGKNHPIKVLPERVKTAAEMFYNEIGIGEDCFSNGVEVSKSDTFDPNGYSELMKVGSLKDFFKLAGGPGSGVAHPNTMPITFLETSPFVSIGYRKKFMNMHRPNHKGITVLWKDIKYKSQDNMVPKKVINIMLNADEALKKPIDVIKDHKGELHILDGHHRAIVAILLKRNLKANIYSMP